MRSTFFIKRAYINFLRNRFNNFSSTINVAVISFFSVLLLVILENAVEFVEQLVLKNSAVIILDNDITVEGITLLENFIKNENSIERYKYISPTDAFEEMKRVFSLNTDPTFIDPDSVLPPIFEIKFSRSIDRDTYNRFVSLLRSTEGFRDFKINLEFLELFFKVKKYSIYLKIVIFFILCISAFYILSNTIGLNLHNNRREEIEIVELLGGDYLDIRIPYILEGIVIVVLGFILGLFIAAGGTYMISPLIKKLFDMSFISFEPVMISYTDLYGVFIIILISGLLGVVRFIRHFIRGLYEENV